MVWPGVAVTRTVKKRFAGVLLAPHSADVGHDCAIGHHPPLLAEGYCRTAMIADNDIAGTGAPRVRVS